jgi:lysophospholipase L1-like esterase
MLTPCKTIPEGEAMKSIGNLFVLALSACVGLSAGNARTAEIRLGHLKAEKILFLGNSITAVPQRNEKIWWGLSASTPAKDYAHLLAAAIDAKTGGSLAMLPTTAPTTKPDGSVEQCDSNVINIADVFERGYASYDAAQIAKQLAWKADIVILQFGENIPPATFKADVFRQGLQKLLADLKATGNPHIVMAGYILGSNATVDEIKRKLCEEDPNHRVFVDLSSVGKDPANMGEYGHPNDKGMALIAETLFQAILAHSATSPKSE